MLLDRLFKPVMSMNEYYVKDSADSEILTSLLFTLYLSIFSTITSLPFTIYSTFVVEENHGFNKQTAGFFAVDQVKKFVVSQAIQVPILAGVIKIVHWGGDYFFVYLWGFVALITIKNLTLHSNVYFSILGKLSQPQQ